MLLRRGVWISYGRTAQTAIRAEEAEGKPMQGGWMPTLLLGACYSFQPEQHAGSTRNEDTVFDFTHHPQTLLAELDPRAPAPRL